MAAVVRTVPGQGLEAYRDGIRAVYAETFAAPPRNEGPERVDAHVDRLDADVRRPGFTAGVALDEHTVLGWATAWSTPEPFPAERCSPQVAAALGAQRSQDWLCGAREVDELAVASRARGTGIGTRLLDAVTDGRADGRCWLLTSTRATDTLRFYERAGWTAATHPAPSGTGCTAFLGPRHPARVLAPRPL